MEDQRIMDALGVPLHGVEPITKIVQLFRVSNPRERSKLARLVGRYIGYKSFIEKRVKDEDNRVRANAIESLWGINDDLARTLLRQATSDPHHRVRMNALLGLYFAGEPGIAEVMVQGAAHPSPVFRAASAWAMGETKSSSFENVLARLSKDSDATVRQQASAALSKVRASSAPSEPAEAPVTAQ